MLRLAKESTVRAQVGTPSLRCIGYTIVVTAGPLNQHQCSTWLHAARQSVNTSCTTASMF